MPFFAVILALAAALVFVLAFFNVPCSKNLIAGGLALLTVALLLAFTAAHWAGHLVHG